MKRISLLVAWCLCWSVAVFAGTVITNDTGENATGLRVVFSSPVLITSFGDILTTIDQTALSYEFVFSGGTVSPWESHWFNYAPATASVATTEWLTGPITAGVPAGELTREDLLNLGRAPTYEEIMSVIAEYPGEDEPLYEPAPDEAIWLTDLEGHADIYDNDSIKINYADWFDQSQISKIEVYRNGIKMRFLPDKLDVLTNEQMKTFDGNLDEHTPASDHTDHAIFGYEYRFRFLTGGETSGVVVQIRSPFGFKGDAYAFLGHNFFDYIGMSESALLQELNALKRAGFTGVSIGANHFLSTNVATTMFAQTTWDSSVCEKWQRTPTDSELRKALRLAEQAGLDSELRVELWVASSYQESQGVGRGALQPEDVQEWFANYRTLCEKYARLAEEECVEILVMGVELISLYQYSEQWSALASHLRTVFSGAVTFNITAGDCSASKLQTNPVSFWNSLDLIEINLWPDGLELATDSDPRFSVIAEKLVSYYTPLFDQYTNQFRDTPIRFGEMGTFNYDGALNDGEAFGESWREPTAKLDHQEYTDTWASFLMLAEFFQVRGLSAWTVWLDPARQPWTGMHEFNLTPAIRVVSAMLGGVLESAAPASSDSLLGSGLSDTPHALVDWNAIPWMESYSPDVTPAKYWTSQGQRPVSEGQNWGLPGGDVKGVSLASNEEGLFIRLETYSASLPGSYGYEFHLRPPGAHDTMLWVRLDPVHEEAEFSMELGEQWHNLGRYIMLSERTDDSITGFIRHVTLPSGDGVGSAVDWDLVTLLVPHLADGFHESYELPHTNVLE